MRVFRQTAALSGSRALGQLSAIKWRMSRAERVAITQLEIARPSDAPSQWTAVHRMAAATEDQATFRANTEISITYLDTADTLLSDGTEVLKRAWEVGVQMANETHSGLSRSAAAKEITALRTRLLSIANTRVANRHVFAGTALDKPPFRDDGTYV
ncbi:MAG: flagellar hook-associated protein 3 FlgL, partial [Kiritimatiellia bacterium]